MKKLLLTIFILLIGASIFAGTNYKEVGIFTTSNEVETIVGIDMRKITKIDFKGEFILYLDPTALYHFNEMLNINLAMVDTVVSEGLTVSYKQNTDRFNYSPYRMVMSYFRTDGTGGEDSCFIELKYIKQAANYASFKLVLNTGDIKQLQNLLSNAQTEGDDIDRQIKILNNKLKEIKRF